MESTKPGIATKVTIARRSDRSVVPRDLFPLLLRWSSILGVAIADRACFAVMPRHKEQKEMVDRRRRLSPTCRIAPLLQPAMVAVFR